MLLIFKRAILQDRLTALLCHHSAAGMLDAPGIALHVSPQDPLPVWSHKSTDAMTVRHTSIGALETAGRPKDANRAQYI